MNSTTNWNEVDDLKEFEKLPAGGYICGITKVEDVADRQYLRIEYDIAEGEFKNYFRNLNESLGFWAGNFIRSYTVKAQGFFKAFLTAVEKSNHTFKVIDFNNDERKLKRMYVGLVLGEEEYLNAKGEVKTRMYVAETRSTQAIKDGDFKVPEFKKLKTTPPTNSKPAEVDFEEIGADDGDLPF